MKLLKSLLTLAILCFASLTSAYSSTVSSMSIDSKPGEPSIAADTRLNTQNQDTTKNIEHYGYKHKGALFGGAIVEELMFTPQTIVNVLDSKFNPAVMSDKNENPSTKNIKKLLQQIVIKTLHRFPGSSKKEKLDLFIRALQEKGTVNVNIKDLSFDKMKAPEPLVSERASQRLYDQIKKAETETETEKTPTPSEILNNFAELYQDGLIVYSDDTIPTTPITKELSDRTIAAKVQRPDFKTFLIYLKAIGIVPHDPASLKELLISESSK